MDTLSMGWQKPETGDWGGVWYEAVRTNAQKGNDHTHNGEDSTRLDSSAIDSVTASISSASWALVSNGIYKQTVTMPNITGSSPSVAMDIDRFTPVFRFSGGDYAGEVAFLHWVKVTDSTYDVYINDNSQNLTVTYTS